ncbi:MAG: AraC family transcriptional regulator [Rubrivivax sp.]
MCIGKAQKRVAAELGLATPSSFSRAFRQRFGVSPRAWLADASG